MDPETTFTRQDEGSRGVLRVAGVFDRAAAWALRDRIERDAAREVVVDLSGVRSYSDLAVAVLAHGLTSTRRRVLLRGFQPHQLTILGHCGVALDEVCEPDLSAPSPRQAPVRLRLR